MSDTPTPETKSATRKKALAILAALAAGAVVAVVVGNRSEVTLWDTDGGEPGPGVRCTVAHLVGDRQAIALLGLDAGAAPYAYGIARTCATPGDAGDVPALPPGITVLEELDEEVEYDGGATMTVWLGDAAPWRCACAPLDAGAGCEQLAPAMPAFGLDGGWEMAPTGVTLAADAWRGTACVRKPCTEVSGWPSMPGACQ